MINNGLSYLINYSIGLDHLFGSLQNCNTNNISFTVVINDDSKFVFITHGNFLNRKLDVNNVCFYVVFNMHI